MLRAPTLAQYSQISMPPFLSYSSSPFIYKHLLISISIPPNCNFEIDDAEEEWLFTEPFDYIHGRALMNCFKDISTVFASAFRALAPGGHFEMQDGCMPFRSADGTLNDTTLLDVSNIPLYILSSLFYWPALTFSSRFSPGSRSYPRNLLLIRCSGATRRLKAQQKSDVSGLIRGTTSQSWKQ